MWSYKKKAIPISGKFNKHTNEMEPKTKNNNLERIKLQARRITSMQEPLACTNTTKIKTPRWRAEIIKQTKNTIEKLVKDTDLGNFKEKRIPR